MLGLGTLPSIEFTVDEVASMGKRLEHDQSCKVLKSLVQGAHPCADELTSRAFFLRKRAYTFR